MRVPAVLYNSVVLLRQFVKGVPRTEMNFAAQCPFTFDSALDEHHFNDVHCALSMLAEAPVKEYQLSDSKASEYISGFVSYVDFSSEDIRVERASHLAFDVSDTPSTTWLCFECVSRNVMNECFSVFLEMLFDQR